ncbi:hypothetical protein KP509_32G055700 [Ceratopteris richardii]|uniref:Uncharacterized protein n=1 Tax=Ceratopteris richardii TaxID=49495 RepID=A0A8T2QV06_CERRI|nr:hypothetical protein KP509_32G055700 [Ceratopteris richardii]
MQGCKGGQAKRNSCHALRSVPERVQVRKVTMHSSLWYGRDAPPNGMSDNGCSSNRKNLQRVRQSKDACMLLKMIGIWRPFCRMPASSINPFHQVLIHFKDQATTQNSTSSSQLPVP